QAPEQAAYAIYTSGSTGLPKGVINTHRAIANRLLWMQRRFPLDATDRVLQKTPIGFDVSVWEFFWPMMAGATLVEAPPGQHADSHDLVEAIKAHQITTIHFVPPMLDALLEVPDVGQCTSLRRIICSGDTLTAATQSRCLRLLPNVELHNLYGPTEAAIDVTAWQCNAEEDDAPVPIGWPIANTEIHLLDRDLNKVPVGIEGELYIGGTGLARGYLGRPDLTAERFLPNPFRANTDQGPSESEVIYATGDRARYRSDGAIEFLGRMDHQIKIRGQRIELAEIEATLERHSLVQRAIAIYQPEREAVTAYFTLEGVPPLVEEDEDPAKALDPFLRAHLPRSMVPQQLIKLEAFSLTPNGKIDRRALPEPTDLPNRTYHPPATATEKEIAEVWKEVLKIEKVSSDDDFFKLGGHSLSATRANTRLRKRFEIDLELRQLFDYPVLVDLARCIDALRIQSAAEESSRSNIDIEI
ncbi:MAG: non-ribosomal peptide synthetase, partial [Verrucomicrobiota bacterium]